MLKQEVVNLVEEVHTALAAAIFVTTVDAVVLIGIDHQVKLFTIRNHGLDELHGVLVVDIVVTTTVAEQVVAFD